MARCVTSASASPWRRASRKQTVELSRGVEVQRTLGEIARSIVEVDDAGETLQQVVDASKRLLGSDGAHLTLMDDDGENLIPMVLAGDTDPATRAWLHRQRFPVGGGIDGVPAAATAAPAWTDDYLADPRLRHDPNDESPASPAAWRRGRRAAVRDRRRGDRHPGHHLHRERATSIRATYRHLQELAGQGSIAARNARLYEQLRDSERRYRHLVDNSPDLVWSVDADGSFTYLGESLERMTGFRPEELLGKPFEVISAAHTRSAVRHGVACHAGASEPAGSPGPASCWWGDHGGRDQHDRHRGGRPFRRRARIGSRHPPT